MNALDQHRHIASEGETNMSLAAANGEDPAIAAAKAQDVAEAAVAALGYRPEDDPVYRSDQDAVMEAGEVFADAVPTTMRGAIRKLQDVLGDHFDPDGRCSTTATRKP